MTPKQQHAPLNVLLADDDKDDISFFDKALKGLPVSTHLTTVNDGEQLMNYLSENLEHLPDILFLDLNMPRKNGFECLCEINENEKLKNISIVIFSTSYPQDKSYELGMISSLFKLGARVYIRKPGDFAQLKQTIQYALPMAAEEISSNNQLKYILNA